MGFEGIVRNSNKGRNHQNNINSTSLKFAFTASAYTTLQHSALLTFRRTRDILERGDGCEPLGPFALEGAPGEVTYSVTCLRSPASQGGTDLAGAPTQPSGGGSMRFGIIAPTSNEYADARTLAELAHEAEEAGWDGFFIWDHILYDAQSMPPVVDTWIALTAIALRTTHIRLGPMVTAVARRRPWKLARETVSLDHLAGGRLTLGVGLGNPA